MTVVVLGGGIGGLSTAYYLLRSRAHKVVLVEATNRVGGWITSEKQPDGVILEQGPRTLRPRGESGLNTLKLIQDLGLTHDIRPIRSSAPAAKNRYVYADKKLYALPTGLKPIFRAVPPFSKPLSRALWHDFNRVPKYVHDDSIYNFVERRFGKEFADYLISPLICGICGGDAKQISVKFLLNSFFEKEQMYGSVVKHYLRPWNWKIIANYNFIELLKFIFDTRFEKDVWNWMINKEKSWKPKRSITSGNDLAKKAKKEKWSSYTFAEGLETLPRALEEKIRGAGGTIMMNSKPIKLDLRERRLIFHNSEITFDFIVGALPPYSLAPLLHEDNYALSELLLRIPHTSIITVNLVYKKKLLNIDGFGFLVPPSENLPILGNNSMFNVSKVMCTN
jgi:oxygen-dependent protoporphyrinogen oxidase